MATTDSTGEKSNNLPDPSYATALNSNLTPVTKTTLIYRSPEIHKGKSTVFFTIQEEEELAKDCKFTLIGKFSHGRPSIEDIISDFSARFTVKGKAKDETIHHTFLDGELARTIWNFFGIPLGIPWEHNTLRTLLMKWWYVKAENGLHKDLLKVIPVVIFWEIWKSRCSNRYEKSKISKAWVIYQVSYHIRWLVTKTNNNKRWKWPWHELCKQIMLLSPKIDCIIVRWIRPPLNWIKLNTDGSHNCEDDIGAGGIVRDSNGNLIMAFAKSLGKGSSNLAEAKAALYGMKWCISNGFRNIILESDSLIIINMLEGKINIAWELQDSIAWELQDSIDTIKQLLS
ncbi:uncharacterized protein LOC132626759 isoform X2 [Lycium barbarum]|uniref:uncharacterized protein LOC132626759 isoform X2 n=1 Tax=Lycium barbarum TaxID=112863 RepID=UPI00293E1652|nr:uncharacterized protein LOC132626759 isoform X2 [Lycium barbarum]